MLVRPSPERGSSPLVHAAAEHAVKTSAHRKAEADLVRFGMPRALRGRLGWWFGPASTEARVPAAFTVTLPPASSKHPSASTLGLGQNG
jgi:hypothetical protein